MCGVWSINPLLQENTAPPHEEEYFYYLEYERKQGDPARVICLMERAITDNPLNSNRWVDYLQYLVGLQWFTAQSDLRRCLHSQTRVDYIKLH